LAKATEHASQPTALAALFRQRRVPGNRTHSRDAA